MTKTTDTATFIKRDGFTLLPTLPKEPGEYLILIRTKKYRIALYQTYTLYDHDIEQGADHWRWQETENAVPLGWARLPDIPEWAEMEAE